MVTTAGIDMGIQTVKIVILKDGEVVARAKAFSGFEPTKAAEQAYAEALSAAKISSEEVSNVSATGSGMDMAPYASGTVSMMGADAKAGVFLFPSARTVIDVGAEEARAVKCDERGIMMDFVVNERCAAGAGAFIEAMARALEVKMEDMGPLSLKAKRASPINATCVIFGESDVVSLIHRQESKPEIARAVFDAMADRISSMVHRLGINPDVVLVGGVAKDVGFIESLKRKLGLTILVPEHPEYAGALGASLTAASRVKGDHK
ncbi:MAG: acyl-CoA dehydratase activase [Candidatus Bathyarchaeota archaeon]|nr:acyl-CoA dehydratase activase [Candidatus Bathyarchaeota archaeon]